MEENALLSTFLYNGLYSNKLGREYARSDAIIEIFFKLKELAHEVEVGRDDRPSHLHKLVGICHGHPSVFHQVCNDNSGRP